MSNRKQFLPQLLWRSILVFSLILPATLAIDLDPVQAGGGPIPLIGLFAGLVKRNKVYKTANSFIKEKEEYYDGLRATAAQQLLDRELTYGLRDNQVAAYTKVVALIEQERQSMYDFAESEKKAARSEFMDAIQDEITGRMLASTPATAMLGAMSKGINSSRGFLDAALTKISGGSGGFMADVAKVKKIAERITIVGSLIGGDFGKKIRSLGTNVVDLINKPTAEIEAGLLDVQAQLGDLGNLVSGLQEKGYSPTVSETTKEVVISLVSGERGDPAIAAIADMLVAKNGGGDFRDRAQDILLGNISARCAAREEQIKKIIFRLQMDIPEAEAEEEQETPPIQACQAIDITALVEEAARTEDTPEDGDPQTEDTEAAQPSQSGETDSSPPPDTASNSTDSGSFSSSSEYIWILSSTETNINNDQTEFHGGGQDPYYFPEERFEGKSLTFGCSANHLSFHDVEVDYEYEFHNVTVGVDIDSPPSRLEPGQEVELKAFASSSGTVNEGGRGSGLRFQYFANNNGLLPVLQYFPWAENFDGTSSGSWTFTAPGAAEGGEFSVSGGLWNAPPCNTIWTYKAQPNDTAPPLEDWENISSLPRRYTPEQCREKQEDVASKVSIARGADIADLELGIVGYVSAQMGPAQISYCEGGEAGAEKGTPIRIGDCLQTGNSGRMLIRMNDRDDKNDKGPSYLSMGSESLMCFSNFAVHRDDGKPGLIDLVKGTLRVITEGWRSGWGFGVQARVRAAVVIGSDVVLEYDPELDLLRSYVNEGSMEVSDTTTGESQLLTAGELMISHQDSLGTVEKMSNRVWKDLIADHGLDLEEDPGSGDDSSSLLDSLNRSRTVLFLIVGGVCGSGILVAVVAGIILYQQRKKKGSA